MTFDRAKLQADLIRDEGLRLKPYRDMVGKLTIGVGRNLDDRGITHEESLYLLVNDMTAVEAEMRLRMPWAAKLSEPRQRALANMLFNLGWPRLSKFERMIAAMIADDFNKAADEALNSLWADQLDGKIDGVHGDRAKRIAAMIRSG